MVSTYAGTRIPTQEQRPCQLQMAGCCCTVQWLHWSQAQQVTTVPCEHALWVKHPRWWWRLLSIVLSVLCHPQAARSQLATLREGVRAAAASNYGVEAAAEAVRQASSDADLRVADIIERCRCVSLRAASFRLASPCVASAPRCSSDYAPA